jgi:HD-like signal output (HDOD) protein
LITQEKIDTYIEKIPPAPEALKETMLLLNAGELSKAASAAQKDPALSAYLQNLVNKPIFGFRHEVKNISQIFGILGVAKSQQTVYSYMISLLSPKEWKLFSLNESSFLTLQAELNAQWQKILQHLSVEDKSVESAIALLPASIIVTEALFSERLEEVKLLRSVDEIDFNTILQRLCGLDLFDIAARIAQKWQMDANIVAIVQAASGVKPSENEDVEKFGKWMHLLLFYTLSKPLYVQAQLNDFIDFQIEYVMDIYEEFSDLMGLTQ